MKKISKHKCSKMLDKKIMPANINYRLNLVEILNLTRKKLFFFSFFEKFFSVFLKITVLLIEK